MSSVQGPTTEEALHLHQILPRRVGQSTAAVVGP